MAQYADIAYWDRRYERMPQPFEWYQGYKDLKETLMKFMRPNSRILIEGCGTSTLGEELYDEGSFSDITCVDLSKIAIRLMEERRRSRMGLNYLVMDMEKLEFPPEVFDVVLDKATVDSILCSGDEEKAQKSVGKMLNEAYQVLKKAGVFLLFSHTKEGRMDMLQKDNLKW
eukprot:CAMPEP_0174291284 /NCGR_PEP_ID=MMETSP0809-20121228/31584_1 /TAXON_ID=73025 ORGANISM="Eutreptiella gymnastica-like, Strain CCMP1594" /NCGR_SAMPLE_ID=MMETSP0809 /ASSEMBLY_ACC=CAM_ASM_000658 /LENGTH=170 /DNA_ID=CAMNT_0015390501 /DNA_START=57 /DNA_END=566 /DNA_ORIENTATION=+